MSKVTLAAAPGRLCTPRDGTIMLRSVNVTGYFTDVVDVLNLGEIGLVVEASDVNVNKGLPLLLRVLNSRGTLGWVYVPTLNEVR